MKSTISILLLFSFVFVTISKSIILVNYELNKKEITEKYCINKNKPEMHCCGKCHLKQKLAEQEAQQNYPVFPDVKNDIQLYCSESLGVLHFQENSGITPAPSNICLHTLFEGTSVFHPPAC
jgi:hypothetical protein